MAGGQTELALGSASLATGGAPGRGVFVTHQFDRPQSRGALADVCATDRGGSRVPGAEERVGDSADLALGGAASRSARDGRVSGILSVGLLEVQTQGERSGVESMAVARPVQAHRPSGGVVQAEGRWSDLSAAEHPTRTRPGHVIAPDELVLARTTSAENLLRSDCQCVADLKGVALGFSKRNDFF